MKNNIKRIREEKNMTQQDCTDNLGITLRAWQTYEQGVSEPKQKLLFKMADMFGVSIDYLLGRAEMTSVEKFGGEFNMSALEKEILDGYVNLPPNLRGDLMDFLQKAVQKVMKESSEEHTVTVQYAARSPDSQGTGTRELTEEQIRALMNAKNHASDLD